MRRVRHLSYCDYVIPLSQKAMQGLVLSNESNVLLERTWHRSSVDDYALSMHAKFNSDAVNGVQMVASLSRGDRQMSSVSPVFNLYRINEASWVETLIATPTVTTSGYAHTAYVNQTALASNELSGRECYAFECRVMRGRRSFIKKQYFNHLGSYDHLILLRRAIEGLEVLKVDD